jgi:hypothetical protein
MRDGAQCCVTSRARERRTWDACAMRAAVLSIALAACGASQPAPLSNRTTAPPQAAIEAGPATGGAATVTRLQEFSSAMCACQDRDCVERVVDDLARWAQDLAGAGEANPTVSRVEDARAKAAADQLTRCMSAVYARRGS